MNNESEFKKLPETQFKKLPYTIQGNCPEFNRQIRNPKITNRYENFFFYNAQLKFEKIYKPQKFRHNEFPEVGHESKKKIQN